MARTASLSQLRDWVRKRADVENVTARFPDAEINDYINQSIARLYTLLDRRDDSYYQSSYTFPTQAGVNTYSLPADFWVTKGVDVGVSTNVKFRARKYMPDEGPWLTSQGVWASGFPVWWRETGDNITFAPVPTGTYTIYLTYTRAPQKLVNDSDTFDGRAGFEEWVVVDAAIKVRRKQRVDCGELQGDKAELESWILAHADRNAAAPERIQDVQQMDNYRYPWGL